MKYHKMVPAETMVSPLGAAKVDTTVVTVYVDDWILAR